VNGDDNRSGRSIVAGRQRPWSAAVLINYLRGI
jgi:hypothetical protein